MDWRALEDKWLKIWDESHIYEANPDSSKPKFFMTVAYPYPNSPQHIGHGRTYTITDVYARYLRMRGYNVLFPMAFHYTGTPILAMSKRLQEKDKELTDAFTNIYKVPPDLLPTFKEPLNIAKYFHQEIKNGMKEIGYSIDWRREFTTIDPHYTKFIEWQFKTLREKGLISKGDHPVGWCPNCGNPVGQHDTVGDKEPEIGEFTLIKFRYDKAVMPTATLRPETVFGVTNIWVNPEATYVETMIDDQRWIVSERCAEKLSYLNRTNVVTKKYLGSQLIGKQVENPLTGLKILILPASFVDPNNATGVVMSVPAHAPFDYQALEDLKKGQKTLQHYQIDPSRIDKLEPISVIRIEGSEVPARDIVLKMKITSQDDPKLEDATDEVYSKEFHVGVMRKTTGIYADLPVAQAKERVKEDMIQQGSGDIMYELLNQPVQCRCGTECIVKIFEKQWFINYADPTWKETTKTCLDGMKVIPEDVRIEFEHTIDWLKEKACARREGLGTKLPWDTDWIIESLSDSVIYMAYYTVAPILKELPIDKVTPPVFDYVFLGVGDVTELSKKTGIDAAQLEVMRTEFTYFYPLDSRHSGRDLIPNHLTFFIFNHVAIFPRKHWPERIVVNGSVLMEGKKMSKSYGNIIPLREALMEFGVDPFRLSLVATAGLLQDVDFSPSLARSIRERLERLNGWAQTILRVKDDEGTVEFAWILPEQWLKSRVNRTVQQATTAMDELRFRDAIQLILYTLDQDIQKYSRFTLSRNEKVKMDYNLLRKILDVRVRLLSPFAPFISCELSSLMNGEEASSTGMWPEYSEDSLDEGVEEAVVFLDQVIDDAKDVMGILKGKPVKMRCYVASMMKTEAYKQLLAGKSIGEVMKSASSQAGDKAAVGTLAKAVQRWSTDLKRMHKTLRTRRQMFYDECSELEILRSFRKYVEEELHLPVEVYAEDDVQKVDPAGRSGRAEPLKPALHIEVNPETL